MAMRLRTHLKQQQQSGDYKPRTWAWIKSCWKPIKSYRFVKRGKKIGWVKVELHYPEGKTVIIPATHVRFARIPQNSQKVGK